MKIGHIELNVSDPMKSKEFYEKVLGFEVVVDQGDQIIWLKLGEQELLLRPGLDVVHSDSCQKSPFNLVFYTDDLIQKKKELTAKGVEFKGEDQGCPIFTDPDGNWFQLVNPNDH
ncbi:VOC family protein [candidate division CSSED10-310 bacterium]|uniref:VOC family protein n=1 Tax=candidate division CSSED10-310 bacterium TaxID=2855610 RepID=A0ABV6Z0S4_UNCC1